MNLEPNSTDSGPSSATEQQSHQIWHNLCYNICKMRVLIPTLLPYKLCCVKRIILKSSIVLYSLAQESHSQMPTGTGKQQQQTR